MLENEIWKPIIDYPNYEVSNFGRVKSLKRNVIGKFNKIRNIKEKILKAGINTRGYYIVVLFKNKKPKTFHVHQLVAIEFLNHVPCGFKLVVNHIDLNPLNNNVNNLELISQRDNSNFKHIKSSSKYTGVSWHKSSKKWQSTISYKVNGKSKLVYLGLFESEIDANNAYKNKLKQVLEIEI